MTLQDRFTSLDAMRGHLRDVVEQLPLDVDVDDRERIRAAVDIACGLSRQLQAELGIIISLVGDEAAGLDPGDP